MSNNGNQNITVKVKFLSVLAQICGTVDTDLHLPPGATLRNLIKNLRTSYPRIEDFFRGNEPRRSFRIMINDISYDETGGLDTALHDGDRVTLYVTLAGG